MDFNQKVRFSDDLTYREVDGEMVLLDMETESFFGLDAVACDIWKLLQEGKTLQETCDELLEIYDVDPERLRKDLETFVENLIKNELATLDTKRLE